MTEREKILESQLKDAKAELALRDAALEKYACEWDKCVGRKALPSTKPVCKTCGGSEQVPNVATLNQRRIGYVPCPSCTDKGGGD